MRALGTTTVITLLLVGAGFLVSSETGLRWGWSMVAGPLEQQLSINAVHGTLLGPIRLEGIEVRTEGLHASVAELQLDWQPARLLARTFHVNELGLRDVSVTMTGVPSSTEPTEPMTIAQMRLPLAVVIENAWLEKLSLQRDGTESPVVVDSVKLRARHSGDRVNIEALNVDAPSYSVSGNTEASLFDDVPLSGTWQWKFSLPDVPAIAGTTRLSGSMNRLEINQSLEPPFNGTGAFVLTDILESVAVDGEITLQEVSLQSILADAPDRTVTARLSVNGNLTRQQATMDIRLEEAGVLQAQLLHQDGNLDAKLHWNDIQWSTESLQVSSRQGRLDLTGTTQDYAVTASLQFDSPDYTSGDLRITGQGSTEALKVTQLALVTAGGEVTGDGRVQWQPSISVSVSLNASRLDPGVLSPEWKGNLSARMQASLSVSEGQRITAVIESLRAQGLLRGYPLDLDVRGSVDGQLVTVDGLNLASGDSKLRVQGRYGDTVKLQWKLDSPDLAALLPHAAGSLSGSGTINGPRRSPRVKLVATGKQVRYEGHSIESLSLDANVDLGGTETSSLSAVLTDARLADNLIAHAGLKGDGTLRKHRLEFTAEAPRVSVSMLMDGQLADNWNFSLAEATLRQSGFPEWILQGGATGRVGKKAYMLSNACWRSKPAEICLEGKGDPNGYQASFRLGDFPFERLSPLLPLDVRLTGAVSGQGRLAQSGAAPAAASLKLETTAGDLLSRRESDDWVKVLGFNEGSLVLDLDRSGLRIAGSLPLTDQGRVAIKAEVEPGSAELVTRPLRGELITDIRDVTFLADLVPEIARLNGRLSSTAGVTGTLANPVLNGSILFEEGLAELNTPNIVVRDINIRLTGKRQGDIGIFAEARSGEGTLKLEGVANMASSVKMVNLDLSGQDFRVMDTPDAQVQVSPKVNVLIEGKRIVLDGEIVIPAANIHPGKRPSSAVSASSDQVIIGDEDAAEPSAGFDVRSRLRLILGDKVEFDGFGLTGNFKGNLSIRDEPGKPASASGKISIIDGKYKAYGQNLDIRLGNLLYAGGDLAEPGIDLEAVRRPAPDVLVGVRVRGSLRSPQLNLFSEPSMAQTDQVSYLVLGRPLNRESTSEEKSMVNRASMGLGLLGGSLLSKEVGETLGVDDIAVEAGAGEDPEMTSLTVGKYLSPDLYISYGIGIFQPISTLRLRYTLSSHWKLVSETSAAASGADLLYVIERGE